MKNLTAILISVIGLFAHSAKAGGGFICRSRNQIALLKIGDPRTENRSYDECNMGVGDQPTDCHPHPYQLTVRDAFLKIRVKEGYLNSTTHLFGTAPGVGSDILIYKEYALQINIDANVINPNVRMRVMRKGSPGNPVEVANYTMPCKSISSAGAPPDLGPSEQ